MSPPTDQEVREYLRVTNTFDEGFPWNTVQDFRSGFTKRWADGLIPVFYPDDPEGCRFVEAMRQIEMRLGPKFDRHPIARNATLEPHTRGIVISLGTATAREDTPPDENCGNVSAEAGKTAYPDSYFNAETGVIDCVLYINIDSEECVANLYGVIHEFGHALGLGRHFNGFGDVVAIGPAFWAVLQTLYANRPGTPHDEIKVPGPTTHTSSNLPKV